MSEPSWILILDDSFANANTSRANVADGTSAFPETPTFGYANDWHDKRGTDYQILNNMCAGGAGASPWAGALWRSHEQFLDQRAVITIPGTSMTSNAGVWLRNGGSTGGGFFIAAAISGYWGYWSAYGSFVNNFGFWNNAFTVNTGHTYTLDVRVWGASPTNFAITITDTTTSTVVYNNTGTTNLGPTSAAGFAIDPGSNGRISRVQLYTDTFATGLLSPSQTGTTTTKIRLNIGAAVGGVPPLVYKLYSSNTGSFTPGPGNLVGDVSAYAGTTYDHTPGGSPGDTIYYILQTNDNASNVVTCPSIVAQTLKSSFSVGLIGDSIMNGLSGPSGVLVTQFQALYPQYSIAITHQDNSGSSSVEWATNNASRLSNAIAAMVTNGCTLCSIMLGANDARSPNFTSAAAFKANIQTIINTIKASIPTMKFILQGTPCVYNPNLLSGNLWDNTSNDRILTYHTQLLSLVDYVTIYPGDFQSFWVFSVNTSYFNSNDCVHPNSTGQAILGQNHSKCIAVAARITPGGTGTGGGGSSMPPRIGPHLIGGISG